MSVETALVRVQNIINVSDASQNLILEELTQIQMEALLARLGSEALPDELEYIVVETTIARYNRIGSEGLDNEKIDVISQTFISDLFEPYLDVIERYRAKTKGNLKRVRLI